MLEKREIKVRIYSVKEMEGRREKSKFMGHKRLTMVFGIAPAQVIL